MHVCVGMCVPVRVCVCIGVTENNEQSDRYMNDAQYTAQRERGDEMKAGGEWIKGAGRW